MSKDRDKADEQRYVLGIHPVEELLQTNASSIKTLYLAPEPRRDGLKAIADKGRAAGLQIVTETMQQLDKRAAGTRHQGAVALTAAFPYADLDAVLKTLKDKEIATVVLLDSVQDPHNTGAIIRSACAFGVDLVVLPKDRAAPITPQVERAAAGTTSRVPIARVVNLKRAMETLKDQGFWIAGAGTRDGVALDKFEFANKTALVIGAEGDGMRAGIEAALDHVVTIPISERAESLNASTAAAVILYERSRKQR